MYLKPIKLQTKNLSTYWEFYLGAVSYSHAAIA